ncbi:MAG: hypothetical protein IKK42_03690 [Oscillospiraceae bacterium]|nr:hypothetical protein [Oscillospiraceae bacterium]
MVTYEGIFSFVIMLTGVISLIYTVTKDSKKKYGNKNNRPASQACGYFQIAKQREHRQG